jgi:hypothetical protein
MEMMIQKIFILIAMVEELLYGKIYFSVFHLYSLYRTYGMDTHWKSSNEST